MIIGGRFELGEVVADGEESRAFAAQEFPGGREVLVHSIFSPSLREMARRCSVGTGGVLDRLSSEGEEYLVTEPGEEFRNLRETLERAAIVPPPAPPAKGPDRFTRVGVWRVPADFAAPSPPVAPSEPSVSGIFSSPAQPGSAEVAQAAGDFTRLFQAPEEAPAPPPPPPPAANEPGEFTRMFRAPVERPASPSPPPPAASEPGEFTRYFRSPLSSRPLPLNEPADLPQAPTAAPPPAAPEPGEYTRLFRMPSAPTAPPALESGATHAFVTPPAFTPAPAVDQGPSDFTRIIQARPQPSAEAKPPEAPRAPAAGPANKGKGVPVWLAVLFTALAALAFFLILFFALRR